MEFAGMVRFRTITWYVFDSLLSTSLLDRKNVIRARRSFIYDGNEKFKIQRFSGGEQDMFNLCLRIAISQIVADRSGGEINFIALDEIFGSQDAESRENILRIFNGLSSQFRQIFLITHIEEMKDMMPVVWSVEEVSEGLSTIIR